MYIRTLNYLDTRDKIVNQIYGHLQYRHLTFEQKLDIVGKTHDTMKEFVIKQKNELK